MAMDDVRAYGDIHGLSPEAFEALRPLIPFPQVKYVGRVLSVDHEGIYIDVEPFIEKVIELMDEDGWGGIDFIDHVEWEVTRYVLKKGSVMVRKVNPDNVLDPLLNEIGS